MGGKELTCYDLILKQTLGFTFLDRAKEIGKAVTQIYSQKGNSTQAYEISRVRFLLPIEDYTCKNVILSSMAFKKITHVNFILAVLFQNLILSEFTFLAKVMHHFHFNNYVLLFKAKRRVKEL